MKVAFRADASIQIGTGHVMRCLTLAEGLTRQGHQCFFISRAHDGHLGELITSKGFELFLLSSGESGVVDGDNAHAGWLGVPWEQDAKEALEVLFRHSADWLVVDHYALDARWEREVASVVGQLLVIDDLADRNHECAVLLDQNLGREASDYDQRVPDECIRMIGPRYALLRPEFARLREHSLPRQRNSELKRILISLGGVDRDNVTGQVLSALEEARLSSSTELEVIMGSAAPHLEDVRRKAEQLPFRATVSVNVHDMADRMFLADLSIGAAGGTSWERCCLGLPALLIILAENQVAGAEALEASGAAMIVGRGESVKTDLASALLKVSEPNLLAHMSHLAASVTSGIGVNSVVRFMASSKDMY